MLFCVALARSLKVLNTPILELSNSHHTSRWMVLSKFMSGLSISCLPAMAEDVECLYSETICLK